MARLTEDDQSESSLPAPSGNRNLHGSTTVVIPAYNESATIGRIVTQACTYVDRVIVVDDGSSDDTARIAIDAGADVLRHAVNQGYGAALATGLKHVKDNGAGMMVVLDGDGQHNPDDIPTLTRLIIEGKADIVTGSRFMRKDDGKIIPAYRRLGIGIVNSGWKMAGGARMTDTQCGFRAYSRNAINAIDITETGMSASLEILDQAYLNRLRVAEVPVSVTYAGDTSTLRPGRHALGLLLFSIKKSARTYPNRQLKLGLLILLGAGALLLLKAIFVYHDSGELDEAFVSGAGCLITSLPLFLLFRTIRSKFHVSGSRIM